MKVVRLHAPRVTKPRDPALEAAKLRHPSSQLPAPKPTSGGVGVGYSARGQHDIGLQMYDLYHMDWNVRELVVLWHRSHMVRHPMYRLTVQKAIHLFMYHWCQIRGCK